MNTPPPAAPYSWVRSQLVAVALSARPSPLARAEQVVDRLLELSLSAGAADLWLGLLLRWFLHADLLDLGFASFQAFCREHVDLGSTRVGELMRLANSQLQLVKVAVSRGSLSLTRARAALRDLEPDASVDDQLAWLAMERQGLLDTDMGRGSRSTAARVRVEGADAKDVHRARLLAELVVGHELSTAAADAHILREWRAGTPGQQLLRRGREPKPAPDPTVPEWPEAEWLHLPGLGHWVEPTDLDHAMQLLAAILDFRRGRALEQGRLYRELVEDRLYRALDYASAAQLLCDRLDLSPRTLQEQARLLSEVELCPGLADALARGLDLDRAMLVLEVADDDTAERWLLLARRMGKRSFRNLVRLHLRLDDLGPTDRVLQAAEQRLADAEEAVARAAGAPEDPDPQARKSGALAGDAPQAQESGAPRSQEWETGSSEARPRVDLLVAERLPSAPDFDRVHPDLPAAARWYLCTVRIPRQGGFQVVRERARYTCANPECRRRTLRCDAHHVEFRSRGGSDDPDTNGLCLCRACHLRLVHTGRVELKCLELSSGRAGMLWTWNTRRRARRVWVS